MARDENPDVGIAVCCVPSFDREYVVYGEWLTAHKARLALIG